VSYREEHAVTRPEFFDCNARIGTWTNPRPEHFTDVRGLLSAMDDAGIARALVHHAQARQWDAVEGNRTLLAEIKGHDRLFPCLVALPPATGEMNPDELVSTCRELHGAVRAFPAEHQWQLAPWCAEDLLAALTGAAVPLFVDLDQTSWGDIVSTMREFPQLPLVLLNTSYRCDRYLYPMWDRGYRVIVGLETYMPFQGLADVCARFGPERLMFATGLPERDAGGPIGLITYAQVSEAEKSKLAGGNLAALLGLGS